MPASEIMRWGALSAVVGGVLLVIAVLYSLIAEVGGGPETFSETALTSSYAITTGMSLLAAVLILFGLVGLNLRQSERSGTLGRVEFLVAFLGTALVVGTVWAEFFVVPSLAVEAPAFLDAEEIPGLLDVGFIASYSLLSLGWALFGLTALRAGIYPRWVPILLIIAALIGLVPFNGGAAPLALGIAVALLGFFFLRLGAGVSAVESSRVR